MSRARAFSSPELQHCATSKPDQTEVICLEGVGPIGTNVRVLLKLIQDHNEATNKGHDTWKTQRVASMMTILDDVKGRLQKSQSSNKKVLRRCNTDLRPNRAPKDKKPSDIPTSDDKDKTRKDITSSLAARKSLEMLCSSLGKEKEVMASQLSRKAHELTEMEQLIGDIKAQNNMLLTKVNACVAADHEDDKNATDDVLTLEENNKTLSDKLLRSLDGYRSLKRRYKDAQDDNTRMCTTMEEIREEVDVELENVSGLKKKFVTLMNEQQPILDDVEKEIAALEHAFHGINVKISKQATQRFERAQTYGDINVSQPLIHA